MSWTRLPEIGFRPEWSIPKMVARRSATASEMMGA
jgi:hypothetical protein